MWKIEVVTLSEFDVNFFHHVDFSIHPDGKVNLHICQCGLDGMCFCTGLPGRRDQDEWNYILLPINFYQLELEK